MKNIKKTIILTIIFAGIFLTIPRQSTAASRNPSDIAKLKKIVNNQVKKGASLSKDVEYDNNYTWDKKGNLKSIKWQECGLTGNIEIPAFNKLKTINIEANSGLKELVIKDNKSLEQIDCPDVEYGCATRKKAKLRKLTIYGCKNLLYLRAGGGNKIKLGFNIRNFTKLTYLSLNSSSLATIDLSRNKNLETLFLNGNKLKKINLSGNKKLDSLFLSDNKLSKIDLSNNKKLNSLSLNGNKLKVINIKNINGINWLDISNNQCQKLDFTSIKKLTTLLLSGNKLEKLDLRNNSKLQHIECDNVSLSGKGLLLGNKPLLKKLICSNNNLTEIDISGCTELSELNCNNNPLPGLSLDNVKLLYTLSCSSCRLDKLDITMLHNLQYLDCRNNKLDELDITQNTEITELHCEGNQIKKLDISKCPYLKNTLVNANLQYDNGIIIKTNKIPPL